MKVGVAKETAPGERRVALVPEVLGKLKAAGLDVLVERGAGAGAAILDGAYEAAGATVVSTDDLYGQSDAILRVAKPSEAEVGRLRSGQALGFLDIDVLVDVSTELGERDSDGHRIGPLSGMARPWDGQARLLYRRGTHCARGHGASSGTSWRVG